MKTIKTLAAAAALSLLALTNAHAGGFFSELRPVMPDDFPEIHHCWPKVPVDPRIIEMLDEFPEIQFPHIRACAPATPFDPYAIDPRVIRHSLPRNPGTSYWLD